LSEFQVDKITMHGISYNNTRTLYDTFYKNYQEYDKTLNARFMKELKGSTLEQLIENLGAYSHINTINGRTFIDWKYAIESYDINMSNNSISSTSTWSSGSYRSNSTSFVTGNGSSFYTPMFRSAYVSDYYRSNRQFATVANTFSTSSTTGVTATFTNGQVQKQVEELSIVIELGTNNQVLNVIQNGILTEPVYGLAFSFY
jgi:hypothetical protein